MSSKAMKLMTVPSNGQISIGKSWAGRQIRVEISETEIHIMAGTFVPETQRQFFTPESKGVLADFNKFELANPPKATNTKNLFATLKKNKRSRDK